MQHVTWYTYQMMQLAWDPEGFGRRLIWRAAVGPDRGLSQMINLLSVFNQRHVKFKEINYIYVYIAT